MPTLLRFFLLACAIFAAVAHAQLPKAVQKASDGTNAITESLAFGAGKTGTFLSGSTLTINGALAGTPTGGTLNLSALTLTLPSAPTFAGTWSGAQGGTGVANTGKTITLGGNLATSGAFGLTLTLTGTTGLTLPTTGTLATLAGSETLTNKSISGATNTLTAIPNSALGNSTVTIGSTSVALGSTTTTFAGLANLSLTGGLLLSGTGYLGVGANGGGSVNTLPASWQGGLGLTWNGSTQNTIYYGDGAGGYQLNFVTRAAGTNTTRMSLTDTGALSVYGGTANAYMTLSGGTQETWHQITNSAVTTGQRYYRLGVASAAGSLPGNGFGLQRMNDAGNSITDTVFGVVPGTFSFGSPYAVSIANATSATTPTAGALTVGNGTAATNVAIGGGNINMGGNITLATNNANIGGSSGALTFGGSYASLNGSVGIGFYIGGSSYGSLTSSALTFTPPLVLNGAGSMASFAYTPIISLGLPGVGSTDTGALFGVSTINGFRRLMVGVGYNDSTGDRAAIYFDTNTGTGGPDGSMSFWTNKNGSSKAARLSISADGAVTVANNLITSPSALTYASPTSIDATAASFYTVTTVNATGSVTFNASTGGTAGQRMTILITNDSTSGKTITFGTNFRAASTLVGTISKAATVSFISDGTSFYEVSRATGL